MIKFARKISRLNRNGSSWRLRAAKRQTVSEIKQAAIAALPFGFSSGLELINPGG